MIKPQWISTLAAATLLASGAAMAQTDNYRAPWRGDFWGYVGVNGGETKFRDECRRTLTQLECDRKDTGWKVYAGGKMNDVVGLEVGYTDFGRIRASGGETEAWAIPVSLVAGVPIGPVSLFGKVGGLYGRTDVSASASTLLDTGHKSGWGWTYGAGAGFNVTKNVQIRADWDRYKLDFAGGRRDVDMLSAGVALRF